MNNDLHHHPNTALTHPAQLVEFFEQQARPPSQWRLGIEYERFVRRRADHSPLPYGGHDGLDVLLHKLQRYGWSPQREAGNRIALHRGAEGVSLEPGGQLEYASAPLRQLDTLETQLTEHLDEVATIERELGARSLALGFEPKASLDDLCWMPHSRYTLMRAYMPQVGTRGLDMMGRCASIQVNLDYADEADMLLKLRVALALQPLVATWVANSPFANNKLTEWRSYRGRVWTRTDEQRCGLPLLLLKDNTGFEDVVNYALDVPMYSVRRGDVHLDLAGQSFRDFLNGRLPGLPGERPSIQDWEDHLNTLMPEVRVKRVLELRGADSGPPEQVMAITAFWVGLLYYRESLHKAWEQIADLGPPVFRRLWQTGPETGFTGKEADPRLRNLSAQLLEWARKGLAAQPIYAGAADYLQPLERAVHGDGSPSDQWRRAYRREWGESIEGIYEASTCDPACLPGRAAHRQPPPSAERPPKQAWQ